MLDFPQTPNDRISLYADTLLLAEKNEEAQCKGVFGLKVDRDGEWVYLHCAMGILMRDVFGISAEEMCHGNTTPVVNAFAQIANDLVRKGFDANEIMRANDREKKTFGEIAEMLRKAVVTA